MSGENYPTCTFVAPPLACKGSGIFTEAIVETPLTQQR